MNASLDNAIAPRWLGWCALATVIAVCPVLFLGALVTSMRVGMADQRSFVWPHVVILELFDGGQSLGWKIEHSHRLVAWFAGLCSIVLAIACWFARTRPGIRWLGLAVLGLIGSQAILGKYRVELNAWWGPDLAWIHGCFAQVVFGILAGLALMVSPGWQAQQDLPEAVGLRRWSLVALGLILGQLILGGIIRHHTNLLAARLHILGTIVLAAVFWLVKLALEHRDVFGKTAWILIGLLGLQIALGVESGMNWMGRYFQPSPGRWESPAQLLLRTSHYFVGSLLFAATVVVALKAFRSAFRLAKTADVLKTSDVCLQGGLA